MLKFRWHRGTLSESMATVIKLKTKQELFDVVRSEYPNAKITSEWYCYDNRIKWDTYLICEDGCAVGMANFDPGKENVSAA